MAKKGTKRISGTSVLWSVLLVLAIVSVGIGYLSLVQPLATPPSATASQIAPEEVSGPTVEPTSSEVPSSTVPSVTRSVAEAPTETLVLPASSTPTEDAEDLATPVPSVVIRSTPTVAATVPSSPAVEVTPTTTITVEEAFTATLSPTPMPTATFTATASAPPTPTSTPTPKPIAPLNPDGHVGLGAYLPDIPFDEFASVDPFEQEIDHRLYFISWYHAWGDADRSFPGRLVQMVIERGAIPIITWEPWSRDFDNPDRIQPGYTLETIVSGDHDEYIRSWARGARSTGAPIILRFAHEQSTQPGQIRWYPWQGSPEMYRAAFQHIVSIFRDEGATNVQFLWSAMWLDQWAHLYYPGDEYVDLVGTTVLNHGIVPSLTWGVWRTFDYLFAGQYEAALQWNKPIIITEWATAEQGGDKAAWLMDGLASVKSNYPLVEGVVLFELPVDREWPAINWSVTSSAKALSAFRKAIRDPYFK